MSETLKSYDAEESEKFKRIAAFDCLGFISTEFQFVVWFRYLVIFENKENISDISLFNKFLILKVGWIVEGEDNDNKFGRFEIKCIKELIFQLIDLLV